MKKAMMFCLVILLNSCHKEERVENTYPELTGSWFNLSSGIRNQVRILNNGKGFVNGSPEIYGDEIGKVKQWYIENDVLYFDKLGNTAKGAYFEINTYPTISTDTIFFDADTILPGRIYIVLNDLTYIK